ncbi:MAG: NDP-sugar synthase [Candidatus Lokiarchaeota archaeon]|nr:NDP-sugar synthase [Candidatus Lokiarchaeota archaeon]
MVIVMIEKIKIIEEICNDIEKAKNSEISAIFKSLIKKITTKIDKYIGDYPTFIEPVFLGENVRIGDDVLLGPNVYIGANSVIGDYVEISNSILLDNVRIGENIKLENCIVGQNSNFNFSKFSAKNSVLVGSGTSKEALKILNM